MRTNISIALVLLFLLSQTANIYADQNFHYYGIVVDDEGTPLNLVDVLIYDESGYKVGTSTSVLLKSVNTDVNGTFSVYLDWGSYKFVFSKKGYVSDVEKYSGVNVPDVNTGKIILNKCVSLRFSVSEVVSSPGSSLSIEFQVRNIGPSEEVVSLESTALEGWVTTIRNENSEVKAVVLPSGNQLNLNLIVDIPTNASSSNVSVTTRGLIESTKTVGIRVEGTKPNFTSSKYPTKQVKPGNTVDYKVQVNNPTRLDGIFTLSTLNVPSDLSVSLLNSEKERINGIFLESKASTEVIVRVVVPKTAAVNTIYNITMRADLNGLTSDLILIASVYQEDTVLILSSKYPSQSIQLGVKTIYPVTIETSSSKQLIQLTTEDVPAGWSVYFKTQDGRQVNSILMDYSTSEQINVEVTPSLSSTKGAYDFKIRADGETAHGDLILNAQVSGSYSIKMNINNLYLSTMAKSTESVSVIVTNTGYSTLNDVELEISQPDGWETSFTPLKVTSLSPNQAQSFVLTFKVPEGTAPKDYLITLRTTSSALSTETQTIRVTVGVETSWTLYGIGLLVISMIAFIFLFKKLRRK